MERRQALQLLGGSLVALSGCAGVRHAVAPGAEEAQPATDPHWGSRFSGYSATDATVEVAATDLPAGTDGTSVVAVETRRYPRGRVLRAGQTVLEAGFDARTRPVTVDLEPSVTEPTGLAHHVATIRPREGGHEASSERGIIAETDRFTLDVSGAVEPVPHPETVGSVEKSGFSRRAREGEYRIAVTEPDSGRTVRVRVFKSSFVRGRNGWHGHDYPPYVDQATSTGMAARVAAAIEAAATDLAADPVRFAVDVVQALPYVPERTGEGADEYIKYPAETLVDGGGDCEDSAILLASVLQSQPYGRDCALIHPPDHMGLGVAGDHYGGTFYPYNGSRYFYVETTGGGWAIGQLPEQYADSSALVFPV